MARTRPEASGQHLYYVTLRGSSWALENLISILDNSGFLYSQVECQMYFLRIYLVIIRMTSSNTDSIICLDWRISEETVRTITNAARPPDFVLRSKLPSRSKT